MKISERATLVDHELAKLYPNPPIPLDHEDSHTLLIAVLLSAQCTDARVNKITPNLFKLASNPLSMSQLSVDEINTIVRPCGLSPRKAQAIHGLSQILLDKHEGKVPRSFEELEELPGVGHKTASVVMAQSFGFPSFPVDTHIHLHLCAHDQKFFRDHFHGLCLCIFSCDLLQLEFHFLS